MNEIATGNLPSLAGMRIAVTGASGQLGQYLVPRIRELGGEPIGLGHRQARGVDHPVDITSFDGVARVLVNTHPDIVIHAAAYTDVDGCETNPSLAFAVNAQGAGNVAQSAANIGAFLISVSTDFVFAGDDAPYAEDADPTPISEYGRTKLAGEQAVHEMNSTYAVARTAWLYGGVGKHFPRTVLRVLHDRGTMEVVKDEFGSPTFAGDLADALIRLAAARVGGVVHLVNEGRASRFELARAVASYAGLDPMRVTETTSRAFLKKHPLPAKRPSDSTLANTRAKAHGIVLRPWEEAISRYVGGLSAELELSAAIRTSRKGVAGT